MKQANTTIRFKNSMYPRRHLYARYMWIPEFFEITGLILPNNPELIGDDYVTVLGLDGDLHFILKSHIVATEGGLGAYGSVTSPEISSSRNTVQPQQKEEILVWMVLSKSKKNKEYRVEFKNGLWFCECPGFQFHHSQCNHINRVKAFNSARKN